MNGLEVRDKKCTGRQEPVRKGLEVRNKECKGGRSPQVI